jgi:hypothetical protein
VGKSLEVFAMPIMSAHEQNDARGTARLLALAARDSIRDPSSATEHEVALNNLYRLLEAYRVSAFFGMEPRARQFPPRVTEAISLLPRSKRRVRDVRVALEQAQAAVFMGQSKDDAVRLLEKVLRGITYPAQFDHPSEDDRSKADIFFNKVVEHLSVG